MGCTLKLGCHMQSWCILTELSYILRNWSTTCRIRVCCAGLGCSCRVELYSEESRCSVQNKGVLCRVGVPCAEWKNAGHSGGGSWKAPGLEPRAQLQRRTGCGSRAAAGHNGQERKPVQTLLWMWSRRGPLSTEFPEKQSGKEQACALHSMGFWRAVWGTGEPSFTERG